MQRHREEKVFFDWTFFIFLKTKDTKWNGFFNQRIRQKKIAHKSDFK
jgi:hypothetical protein